MPTNTPIPTVSTGGVIAAATQNDMTVLNTDVGLFGAGGGLVGSPPAVNAPNFQIQSGSPSLSFLGGVSAGVVFPTAFPNGVLSVVAIPYNPASVTDQTLDLYAVSLTQFQLGCTSGGANFGGTINVCWIAIGF